MRVLLVLAATFLAGSASAGAYRCEQADNLLSTLNFYEDFTGASQSEMKIQIERLKEILCVNPDFGSVDLFYASGAVAFKNSGLHSSWSYENGMFSGLAANMISRHLYFPNGKYHWAFSVHDTYHARHYPDGLEFLKNFPGGVEYIYPVSSTTLSQSAYVMEDITGHNNHVFKTCCWYYPSGARAMKLNSMFMDPECTDYNKEWFYPNGAPAFIAGADPHWLRLDGTRVENAPAFDHPIYGIMWLLGIDPAHAKGRYTYEELNLMYGLKLIEDSI